jgi:hypothetical protein
MRPARILRPVAAAGVAVTLAACGSTVQMGPSAVGAPQGGLSVPSGAPGQPGALATAPAGAASGGGAGGTAAGAVAGQTGTTASGTTSGATSTGAKRTTSDTGVVANAPGVTADTVYLGVGYSSQSAAADKTIGAGGASPSYDFRDVFNAAAKYANEHGGFAGRKLEPIFYDYNLTDPQDQQDQSACAYWTQDHKVFGVFPAGKSDVLHACMEKSGGISLMSGNGTRTTFEKFPHFVDPISMRLDRLGAVTANGLSKAGYFAGKLGVVTWDDNNYKFALQQGMLPALASHGITPTQTAYILVPQTVDAISDMTAAVSSAVTKFRTLGIDHVIVQDGPAGVWSGAGLTFEWMNQADSQRWYPRYGANANNAPGWDVLPADQQDHEIAVFDSDHAPKYDQGWHNNPTREKCFKIMADAGIPANSSNENDEGLAAQACDAVFFLQTVFNKSSVITNDTFMQTVERLGRSWPSAAVYGTELKPGQHDGSAAVRAAEYSAGCRCLTYKGPPYYP